jgi:4-alpha-glucanotransferase
MLRHEAREQEIGSLLSDRRSLPTNSAPFDPPLGAFVDNLTQVASTDQSCVFPPGYRASGILLHVTSLPSRYGIGDFGPEAIRWIDALADAGQTWWQLLPIGPPVAGNSPYTPLSTFACNPLLISPDSLVEDGLLEAHECEPPHFREDRIDFGAVIPFKQRLLDAAWLRYTNGHFPYLQTGFDAFCKAQARWLHDFALFMVLKNRFGGASYVQWPAEYRLRDRGALQEVESER